MYVKKTVNLVVLFQNDFAVFLCSIVDLTGCAVFYYVHVMIKMRCYYFLCCVYSLAAEIAFEKSVLALFEILQQSVI